MAPRALFIFLVCFSALIAVNSARAQSAAAIATGSISGRVTLDGKAAPNVTVVLLPGERQFPPSGNPTGRTVTDSEGNFRFNSVPAGHYDVTPHAPAFVVTNVGERKYYYAAMGKTVMLREGEAVEGINFTLIRGGVITGRVTNAAARPVIGIPVLLARIEGKRQEPVQYYSPDVSRTDDRGIYRIYGLLPGHYKVSVGQEKKGGINWEEGLSSRGYYSRTFYPGTQNEAEAVIVEVAAGSEVAGIDIKVGERSPTYQVSGRIINEETGQPLTHVYLTLGTRGDDGRASGMLLSGFGVDENGEFHLPGLLPGRYTISAGFESETDLYCPPAAFEIKDEDVSGVEVKARRGLSLVGTAVLENTGISPTPVDLSQLLLGVTVSSEESNEPNHATSQIAADGSFRFGGLRPGKAHIYLRNYPPPKGVSILRVERNGVAQPDGVEIAPSEQVTGVLVHIVYGTGVIRGQVKVEGGTLPDKARLTVNARRTDGNASRVSPVEVDERGQFIIEGLAPGEYELALAANIPPTSDGSGASRSLEARQNVTVVNDTEVEATIVLNLNGGGQP